MGGEKVDILCKGNVDEQLALWEEGGRAAGKGGGMEEELFLFELSWQQLEQVEILLSRDLKAIPGA